MEGVTRWYPLKFTCPWCGAEQTKKIKEVPTGARISIEPYCDLPQCHRKVTLKCTMTPQGLRLLATEKATIVARAWNFRGRARGKLKK